MSVTLISDQVSVRRILVSAAMLAWVGFVAPACAVDSSPENDNGFFSYFPAPPDIKLPNIDIFHLFTSDLKIGKKAYRSGDYTKALQYFRKSSNDGNAVADWYLGHMYRLGRGVPADPAVAYSYYSRVAEAYDPDDTDPARLHITIDSQLYLTQYTQQGLPSAGISADPTLAARNYLRIASNYGHPRAMFELGVLNLRGNGVAQNPQQGLKWLIAAARKRDPVAEAYLGDLYWKGEFVRQDETRALMWYILAMEKLPRQDFPAIFARYSDFRAKVGEDISLEADARARVWAEQYPAKPPE